MKKTLLWISFILLLGVNICLFYFLLSKKSYLVEVWLSKLRGGGMDWNIALQVVKEDCKVRFEDIAAGEGEVISGERIFEYEQYLVKLLAYLGIEAENKEEEEFRFLSPIDNFVALPVSDGCWVAVVQTNEQIVMMGYEKKNGKMVKLLIKNLPSELIEENYEEF